MLHWVSLIQKFPLEFMLIHANKNLTYGSHCLLANLTFCHSCHNFNCLLTISWISISKSFYFPLFLCNTFVNDLVWIRLCLPILTLLLFFDYFAQQLKTSIHVVYCIYGCHKAHMKHIDDTSDPRPTANAEKKHQHQ